MIGTDPDTKKIIKEVLTEDFVRETNRTFSLSDKTIDQYKIVQQFIGLTIVKDLTNILVLLSEEILLNNKLLEKNDAVQEIFSNFSYQVIEVESTSTRTTILMSVGGNPEFENCKDCVGEKHLFFIPWIHHFCSRISTKLRNSTDLINLCYFIEFNNDNKISKISLYKM